MELNIITLQDHLSSERSDIAKVIKIVSQKAQEVKQAFLVTSGNAGTVNSTGDNQEKLDLYADKIFCNALKSLEEVRFIASEEQELPITKETGSLSVVIDPLDGSSCIKTNGAVGTIVGIFEGDIKNRAIVGSLYILYGPLTTLMYTIGKGVHQFVLYNGQFILKKSDIKIPEGKIYGTGGQKKLYIKEHAQLLDKLSEDGFKLRYSGVFVADLNQVIEYGGLFTYPRLKGKLNGKLRLLFEAYPLAYIVEQAEGCATNGEKRILEIVPTNIHERTPLYIGSKKVVQSINISTKDEGGDHSMTNNNKMKREDVLVPASVPKESKEEYITNYLKLTKNTGNLMLFAGDQKIEHLNDDFYGETSLGKIALEDNDPKHLFEIASKATIGAFATQYGLVARYGPAYKDVPFLVKLNSKSNLVKTSQKDPLSKQLVKIEDVVRLKKEHDLNILGVGYTVYIGSEFESQMLSEAAQIVVDAHKHGLMVMFWMYPRGKAVQNEKDSHLIAGAAGVGACLGADFVKVNYPKGEQPEELFKEVTQAAGKTKVVTSGGSSVGHKEFLENLWKQIHISGSSGNATGRNIHQRPLGKALALANAIASITLGNKDVGFAIEVAEGRAHFTLE